MTDKVKSLKVASSQESLSCQLMDELRKTCLDPKYDHMHISTLIGVLEMIKWEMLQRN